MVGKRRKEQISRPIARLAKSGIEIVSGEIERIDLQARSVRVAGTDIAADYTVVALGAELAPETIPGLTEAGRNFYTLDGALELERARAVNLLWSKAVLVPAQSCCKAQACAICAAIPRFGEISLFPKNATLLRPLSQFPVRPV